jgi:hypothetical protein
MRHRGTHTLTGAVLVLLALARPGEVRAQQPVAGALHAVASRYGAWLIAGFDSIPESLYSYKPTPAQQTIGYIAQHLEASNYALCSFFGPAKHVRSARDSTADTAKARWPKDTLSVRLRESFEFCERAIAALTDADLGAPVKGGPTGVRADFVAAWTADLADHYSQLANYMRLNGLLPPSARPSGKRS